MRPVDVTIEGLRSFRRAVTIDFADRQLVAIIGDTGAGKSSILEALTWALYGNATWTKHAGALIGDGCPQMRVRLVFDADGNRWQVTRAVKRRQDGTPGVTSAELVCLDADRPAADGVRQVNPLVERLLGLDWDAFIRTVVLPQGQFARLLTEGDVDRMRILAQIWRTDELVDARSQADDALRELTAHLEYLRGRRQGYPDDPGAELEAAAAQARDAEVAASALDAAAREVERGRQAAQEARRAATTIVEAIAILEDAVVGDEPQQASQLTATAATMAKQLRALEASIGEAELHIQALDQPEGDGGPDHDATVLAMRTLEDLTASLDDLASTLRRIHALRRDTESARTDAERLRRQLDDAVRLVQQAEEQEAHWRQVDAAATAAHGLHHGDDCPVCARPLPDGWAAPDASALEDATVALRVARDRAQQLRDGHSVRLARATTTASHAEVAASELSSRLGKVAAAVAGLPDPFRPPLPQPFTVDALHEQDLTDVLVRDARSAAHARRERFEARDSQLRAARDALHGLREQAAALRDQRHTAVTEPATRLRAGLQRIRDRVGALEQAGVELPISVPAVGDSLEQLARDATMLGAAAQAGLTAAQAAAQEAGRAAAEHEEALGALLARNRAASAEALADRQVQLKADAQRLRDRADELARVVPLVSALDHHLDACAEAAGSLTDLKTLLQDGRFVRWLTLRRSKALLAVASTLLDEITGGRYAFADITDEHDEWRIFDTDTGYARSPRTLSGGESFVASLALALGMVEMVARSGGRLDALFLDEGFGALDPENLDAAIDALESSATRGRMVAVISHVQAVAERLTDVLAVDRAPTGSDARWLAPAEREGVTAADATGHLAGLPGRS